MAYRSPPGPEILSSRLSSDATRRRTRRVGPGRAAYAALLDAASTGAGLLDDVGIALVGEAVAAWDSSPPPLAWDELPDRDRRPGARLAVLATVVPYRITDEDAAAWLKPPFTDQCLVHLTAYGAFAAIDRIESARPLPALMERP
ncbi:hypothetical protein ACFRAO_02090 [Streptomyces sp. NPDC056656]|uniref:hypothetical protein n=1 Tax=Streptomyces sp. NPDC056656 TaxID=3345895 RepID=UPI0036AF4E7A